MKVLKIGMWVYVKLIRSWLSPLLYFFLRALIYRGDMPDEFDEIKDLSIEEFHKEISRRKYDYYQDPVNGLLDFSPRNPNFFFKAYIESGRDCTAWSRLWKYYFDYNGIENKEIAMNDLEGSAHMVCVAKIDHEWELFDYRPAGKAETINEVLDENVVGYENYHWFEYKDRFYLILIILFLLIRWLII